MQDPQQVPEGLAAIFSDPKGRRRLFEAKRLVTHRMIDFGLVSELELAKRISTPRDDVGQRDLHCEADGSVQDDIDLHCCETLRCVQDATRRHDCWH